MKETAPFYDHSFKTVSVRNVKYSAPYMHNGSMSDLESVMDFYNKGGGQGIGLSVDHQTLSGEPLNLSKSEMEEIKEYINSLYPAKLVHLSHHQQTAREFITKLGFTSLIEYTNNNSGNVITIFHHNNIILNSESRLGVN